jgi:hypothetical protein
MERIIRVVYNSPIKDGEVGIQSNKDYITKESSAEIAIEKVRAEMQKMIDVIGGEIVSISEI